MNDPVLRAVNLSKSFKDAGRELSVLRSVNFEIAQGETVAIAGASGSGKSTFLHCLGGLDKLTEGKIFWGAQDITQLSENKRCSLRNRQLGFVYQFHHLLNEFTALENVSIPLLIAEKSVEEAREAAHAMLKEVGLAERVFTNQGSSLGVNVNVLPWPVPWSHVRNVFLLMNRRGILIVKLLKPWSIYCLN